MLNIDKPQFGQWIQVLLKVDKTRPEWVVLQPKYKEQAQFVLTRSISDIYERMAYVFPESSPVLISPSQYPNVTGAKPNVEAATEILSRINYLPGSTLLIEAERKVVIDALATIYPMLYACDSSAIPEAMGYSELVAAHSAMLEFIHLGLSVTPYGVLNVEGEIIDGTGQIQA